MLNGCKPTKLITVLAQNSEVLREKERLRLLHNVKAPRHPKSGKKDTKKREWSTLSIMREKRALLMSPQAPQSSPQAHQSSPQAPQSSPQAPQSSPRAPSRP